MLRPAIFRGQNAQNLVDRLIHIERGSLCPVGVVVIEPIDPAGKLFVFIVGKVRFFQGTEIFPAVDQPTDALLRLVPVQLDGGVPLKAGFIILTGEFDPLTAVRFIASDVTKPALAIRLP